MPDYRTWWQTTPLNPVEQLRVQHDLDTLAHLAHQITEVNAALARLSVCNPWSEDVPFLLQMPGIELVSAMAILSAVGDITRFPTPKHLVGYAGLGRGFAVLVKPPMLVPSLSRDGVNCALPHSGGLGGCPPLAFLARVLQPFSTLQRRTESHHYHCP